MLILGLLFLAGAGVFTGLVIADNNSGGPEYDVSVVGHSLATMNSLEIFCAGLALALIFCLGIAMTMAGSVHHRHRSRKLREARRTAADTARERDALAARLSAGEQEPAPARDEFAYDSTRADDSTRAFHTTPDGTEPTGRTEPEPEGTDAPRHRTPRHLFGH